MSDREPQTDTKAKIRQVALELFAEQGYQKTSLREIADRLDVTKAALYYHFKTKEEIVTSLIEDMAADADALISWASEQPRTAKTRREILRKYAASTQQRHQLFRFFQENQPAVRELAAGIDFHKRLEQLLAMLSDPTDDLEQQIRSRLALFAIHVTPFAMRDVKVDPDERDAAALRVAEKLVAK